MKPEDVDLICGKLVAFDFMDNHPKSAQEYANWVLSHMDLFWQGRMVNAYLANLTMPKPLCKPRECVKTLRVLHEITTHCTNVDVKRLVLTTDLMVLIRDMISTHDVRQIIVRSCLNLLSNLILCGWRIRDTFGESGLLCEILKLMQGQKGIQAKQKPLLSQILWLLYHFLSYKVPGPSVNDLKMIAKTLGSLMSFQEYANVLVSLLKIARLISEYHSAMFPVMIQTELLDRVMRFLSSPLPEIQREAIFILANSCQLHRKQKNTGLFRFPKHILAPMYELILGGTVEIRVLVLYALGGIIDHRCVQPDQMLGMLKRIISCTSATEKEPTVRLAASWTLVSLAMHLKSESYPYFLKLGGVNAVCNLLHENLPVQLMRNVLSVLLLVLESYRHLKVYLMHVLRECNVWPIIDRLQKSRNASIRSLAKLLRNRQLECWVEMLVDLG